MRPISELHGATALSTVFAVSLSPAHDAADCDPDDQDHTTSRQADQKPRVVNVVAEHVPERVVTVLPT